MLPQRLLQRVRQCLLQHLLQCLLQCLIASCRSCVDTFDEALYRRCIAACALEEDFGEWPEGDRAVIGAKGEMVGHGHQSPARACGDVIFCPPDN